MNINWLMLLAAIALLWPPMAISKSHYLKKSRRGYRTATHPKEFFCLWIHWVDLVRAFAGTFLLLNYGVVVNPEAVSENADKIVLVTNMMIILVGVLLQGVRFSWAKIAFLAPLFYLSGITLVWSDWDLGGLAVLVGTLLAFGAKDVKYFLPAMGLAMVAGGYLMGGSRVALVANLIIVFAIPGVCIMWSDALAYVTRRTTHEGTKIA